MRPHQPTPTPHMKGDNERQRETRPLQSPRRRPHQPTPTPHIKGDNRRQWETTGDKTTSEPKKPTTPTNTKAARSKVALRTPTVNCLGKNAGHINVHSNKNIRGSLLICHWVGKVFIPVPLTDLKSNHLSFLSFFIVLSHDFLSISNAMIIYLHDFLVGQNKKQSAHHQ